MRAEVKARGLITNGDKAMLEERLAIDDTYGVFRGDLTSIGENHLRQAYITRKFLLWENDKDSLKVSKHTTNTSEIIGLLKRGNRQSTLDCPRRTIVWVNLPEN